MNKKQLRGVIFTLLGVTSQLWGQLTYQFEIELNSETETMLVSQTIEFTNTSNEALATLIYMIGPIPTEVRPPPSQSFGK